MSKILLVGPIYTPASAEIGIANGIKSLGIDLEIVDPRQCNKMGKSWKEDIAEKGATSDFVLVPGCTPYRDEISWVKSVISTPIVNWNAEEIRLPQYLNKVAMSESVYDFIFHFDESALKFYKRRDKVAWLPLGFDPTRHVNVGSEKFPSMVFIGNVGGKHQNRFELLSKLIKENVSCKILRSYDVSKNSELYSKSAAVLNLALDTGDKNCASYNGYGWQQRVFEAMGSDAVIFTNRPWGYPRYNRLAGIVPNKNIVLFDKRNVVHKAIWLLSNSDIRKSARKNISKVKHLHTYSRRIEKIIEVLSVKNII